MEKPNFVQINETTVIDVNKVVSIFFFKKKEAPFIGIQMINNLDKDVAATDEVAAKKFIADFMKAVSG